MIRLGERQDLTVRKIKNFGVYLGSEGEEDDVLLPAKFVQEGCRVGDTINVFVYRDSSDRLIATTADPALHLGEIALLPVRQVTKIGAFMDWGLEKDLLLPFHEQSCEVEEGRSYPVALYIDKSNRLCATMRLYDYLRTDSPYSRGDHVEGVIYQINERVGAFIAVDMKYHGMVPACKCRGRRHVGDRVRTLVVRVRDDGKLELSFNEPVKEQMGIDAQKIMDLLDSYDGVLPFTEKAAPAVIDRELGMSKAAFKRAVGHLLKEGRIRIEEGRIRRS